MDRFDQAMPARNPSARGGWLAAFALSFALYAATASRGAQWQDSGQHILRILTGELVNPGGLALSHPLHFWLGSLMAAASPSQPAFGVTLVSAVAGAIAVANVFGCVLTLTRRRAAAALAASSLAMAHTFWQLATITESYTLTAALLSGELWAVAAFGARRAPRFMYLAALCNGLAVGNHLQGAITSPLLLALGAVMWRCGAARGRQVALAILVAMVASSPYTGLVAWEALRTGDTVGTIGSALFGERFAGAVLHAGLPARAVATCVAFTLLSFPNLTLPLTVMGMCRGRRVIDSLGTRRYLAATLLLHAIFVIRYDIIDPHTFLLPTFVVVCVYAGVGAGWIIPRSRNPRGGEGLSASAVSRGDVRVPEPEPRTSARAKPLELRASIGFHGAFTLAAALLSITPLVYAIAPAIARRAGALRAVERNKPYRDDYRYLLWPWSVADRSAERLASHAARLAAPDGAIIVEDPMAEFAVRYVTMRENLPRIVVTRAGSSGTTILESVRSGRPVALVPAEAGKPKTSTPTGQWKPDGPLFSLNPARE